MVSCEVILIVAWKAFQKVPLEGKKKEAKLSNMQWLKWY